MSMFQSRVGGAQMPFRAGYVLLAGFRKFTEVTYRALVGKYTALGRGSNL